MTSLNELLEIPGNRFVFEQLKQHLGTRRAVCFVGAGASAGLYPMWGAFIELLADLAVAEGKASAKDAARWKADQGATPQQRVDNIRDRLLASSYHSFLRKTFGPKCGADRRRFTPTHAALLRLPFGGYVTTNYDPALAHARIELRQGCRDTSEPTWQDEEVVHSWLTGDVFDGPNACPILWLHGHWERSEGIVLNSGKYSQAYKPGLYRETFKRLWVQDHITFVGFGFGDPQFTFMVSEILRDVASASREPRHVAIIGLPVKARRKLDLEELREKRKRFEADYSVRPLFYPVPGKDHGALQVLLDGLAASCEGALPFVPPAPPAEPAVRAETVRLEPPFHARWFHEPSNDAKFTGRDDEIARLDRWVHDDKVRAVGVCAVGGTGKTALIGHWLRNTRGWRSRPFVGLFAWSFYQSRDTKHFLREFLSWAHVALGTSQPANDAQLLSSVLEVLRVHPCVLILDGLEVLQEGPEYDRHGVFLDGVLRELLTRMCRAEHRSLAVLTSRFAFADLERHLGTAFHQLGLPGLLPMQGAGLLAQLKVGGATREREDISRRLEGHPLGLRVFADSLPDLERDQPGAFLDGAFSLKKLQSDGSAPLVRRIASLLSFYQDRLPPEQVKLLSVVSLFRTPVADEAVLHLAGELFGLNPARLKADLQRLQARRILTREPIAGGHGSACHPVLRDHFRAVLMGTGTDMARRAADLLTGRPSKQAPRSVKEIEPVLLAIELLLDAGSFVEADELFESRLEDGGVFRDLASALDGHKCALGFVQNEERRNQCERHLSRERTNNYLRLVSGFALDCGDLASALEHLEFCIADCSINHENFWGIQAEVFAMMGRLTQADERSERAVLFAQKTRNREFGSIMLPIRGWVRSASGRLRAAAEDFAAAQECLKDEWMVMLSGCPLHFESGCRWTEILLRSGHLEQATELARTYLPHSKSQGSNIHTARFHWLLGWCALEAGRLDEAGAELGQAEAIVHHGQVLPDLARVHLTAGFLALARKEAAVALERAAEALDLAAPRGMRLYHADALILRGQALLLSAGADGSARARNDSEEALGLARDCGYAWGERDALRLLAEALAALGRQDAARRARDEASELSAKLILSTTDLKEADAKAEQWLAAWDLR